MAWCFRLKQIVCRFGQGHTSGAMLLFFFANLVELGSACHCAHGVIGSSPVWRGLFSFFIDCLTFLGLIAPTCSYLKHKLRIPNGHVRTNDRAILVTKNKNNNPRRDVVIFIHWVFFFVLSACDNPRIWPNRPEPVTLIAGRFRRRRKCQRSSNLSREQEV